MAVSDQGKHVSVGPAEVTINTAEKDTATGVNDNEANGGEQSLQQLRDTLDELRVQLERRSERAVGAVRGTVQDYPLASVAGAALIGAIIGLAVTPSRRRRHLRVGGFDVTHPMQHVSMPNMPSMPSMPSRSSLEPITSRFERLADHLSRIDSGSASTFAKTAKQWIDNAVDQLGAYRNR